MTVGAEPPVPDTRTTPQDMAQMPRIDEGVLLTWDEARLIAKEHPCQRAIVEICCEANSPMSKLRPPYTNGCKCFRVTEAIDFT